MSEMQNHTPTRVEIPCLDSDLESRLVLNTNKWDKSSIQDAIISFSMLEDVADHVFSQLEKDIESVSTRIDGLQQRIHSSSDAIQKLKKKNTKTTFYSAPFYPEWNASDVQPGRLSLENVNEDEVVSRIYDTWSIHQDAVHSHAPMTPDASNMLTAAQSLHATPSAVSLQPSSYLYPHQIMNTANLTSIQEPVSHYLEANLNYSYDPDSYFYDGENPSQEDNTSSDSSFSLSDSDSDSDSGEEIVVVHRKSRRESRRATARISLIMANTPAPETHSLLHHQPTRQSVKPTVVTPPMILREKAEPPPPPPSSPLPRGSEVAAASQTPSQPPARPPALHANLLAEIRASGGHVAKQTPPATALRQDMRSTQSTQSTQNTQTTKENAAAQQRREESPRKASSFLSEINGADIKSLLRKRREEISKSVSVESQPTPASEPEGSEASAKAGEKEDSHAQPAQSLDLLQRRKLLFIESSSSESSDWEMSDCSVCRTKPV